MGKLKNPETIILKNKFYPNGLKEIDVYNYYQKSKGLILDQIRTREIMIAIMVNVNKFILRRKLNGKVIHLTPSNYDSINTGRTISLYSTMSFYEIIAIVDIDVDNFEEAKIPTLDVYNVLNKADFIRNLTIRYTGKTGFHILCELNRKTRIDDAKLQLERYLINQKQIRKLYTISPKRTAGIPNIDLYASNKNRGAFITLHSLSLIGLKCMNLQPNEIRSFKPEKARI